MPIATSYIKMRNNKCFRISFLEALKWDEIRSVAQTQIMDVAARMGFGKRRF